MATMALSSYRVIDMGQVWAGPLLGQLFGDFGAEVIRVETRRREGLQSGARLMPTDPNDPMSLQTFGRNKLSVSLDLTNSRGQVLFKELVKVSDVVFENFSPRVMKRFGLDYEALRRVKPDIVMASLSAAGQYGPWRDIVTYGPSLTALYGIKSHLGYQGELKLQEDVADLDPAAAAYGFFALLAALEYRERTGVGQYIDLAQGQAGVCSYAESIMDYTMNGRILGAQGNRYAGMAPHGMYRCQGEDKWVSIAVKTQDEWEGLCKALGDPAWAVEAKFADPYQRFEHQDELDELISEWCIQRTHRDVAALLQAQGVAASPVFNAEELFLDPHCAYRRGIVHVEHPNLSPGEAAYGIPWKLSDTPGSIREPNPAIGSHNRHVFGELLGFSDDQIEELAQQRVLY